MTIQQLLQNPDFSQKFILEKLLCHQLNMTREMLWTHSDQELSPSILQTIQRQYQEYTVDQKPLEYILGKVSFFGTDFIVNENTLIPRPETEYMIQGITEYLKNQDKEFILMDIGTGCGVLGISVLLQNPKSFTTVFFSDISPQALEVAKKNYEILIQKKELQNFFLISDLCSFWKEYEANYQKDIILIANLPYIPEETFSNNAPQNVQNREPRLAFAGGDDGLHYYRIMFDQWENYQSKQHLTMFLEMMTRQVEILRQEYGNTIDFEEIKTFHFNIRIVQATFKS